MNDQEAIVLLKSDSHEAFEYLYKVYGGQVYNFSKLYINSSEDIKEVRKCLSSYGKRVLF